MKTSCEKCIFADYADSTEPCKFNIIPEIKLIHELNISENNFYNIKDYYCKYGFSLDLYDKHKETIGSIDDLKKQIQDKAQIKYYMVVNINDISNLDNVCKAINALIIKPKFVSFLLHQSNNTEHIIDTIRKTFQDDISWKIHNFLEDTTLNHMISTVFDTNAKKNDTIYFWIDEDSNYELWNQEISRINKLIYVQQPKCHGIFRSDSKDGMFLTFDLYSSMKIHLNNDIFKAIESIENPNFIYYA